MSWHRGGLRARSRVRPVGVWSSPFERSGAVAYQVRYVSLDLKAGVKAGNSDTERKNGGTLGPHVRRRPKDVRGEANRWMLRPPRPPVATGPATAPAAAVGAPAGSEQARSLTGTGSTAASGMVSRTGTGAPRAVRPADPSPRYAPWAAAPTGAARHPKRPPRFRLSGRVRPRLPPLLRPRPHLRPRPRRTRPT